MIMTRCSSRGPELLTVVGHQRQSSAGLIRCAAVQIEKKKIKIKSSKFLDGMYTVHGVLESPMPVKVAYDLLLDVGNTHNVYRNISESEMWLAEDGERRLTQHCGWNFLFFAGTFPVVLDVLEDHESRTLEFNLIESKFMKDMKGHWKVSAAENGHCVVDHTLSVKPVVVPPGMIGSFTKRIFAKQVAQILEDLQVALQNSSLHVDAQEQQKETT